MTKAVRGCGSFREVFFAQTHASAPQTLGAHFAPWAEARTSTQQKCPEFIAWVGGTSCHFFDDAPKKWSVLNDEWISCWSHPTNRTSSSTKRTIHVQHAGHSPHSQFSFWRLNTKQANVWDEVTTGPPQIGRQKAKKSCKTYLAGQTELKEKWWELMNLTEYTACLRAHGYTAQWSWINFRGRKRKKKHCRGNYCKM